MAEVQIGDVVELLAQTQWSGTVFTGRVGGA